MSQWGEAINHFFESQMQWYFDNGVFWICGRDIVAIMIGICIGIIFAYFIQLIKVLTGDKK